MYPRVLKLRSLSIAQPLKQNGNVSATNGIAKYRYSSTRTRVQVGSSCEAIGLVGVPSHCYQIPYLVVIATGGGSLDVLNL